MVTFLKTHLWGLGLCLLLSIGATALGSAFPIVGGAVFGLLLGMLLAPIFKRCRPWLDPGMRFAAKKVLQGAVILLGFGLNLKSIAQTGLGAFPVILAVILTALLVAWLFQRAFALSTTTATLIGVGSSICGGSAIAATAPVVEADDQAIAQAISVVFFFNLLAALLYPSLGLCLGFSTTSADGFGVFAGTAINDTSSVTACAAVWDGMHHLGSATLDKAVTVKLTRTLAIIPIVMGLSYLHLRAQRKDVPQGGQGARVWRLFPRFILYFLLASLITTLCDIAIVKTTLATWHIDTALCFKGLKTLAKLFIVIAMVAIGFNTQVLKLFRSGGKPLALGACCWVAIALVSLAMQKLLGIF